WNKWFCEAINPESCRSYARSGATWTHTEATTYDTEEYSERYGEVIAGALAWSGNFKLCFDRNISRLNISAGINPYASTYKLAAGETFVTPDMIWTWSGNGAGQASRNLHAWGRKYGVYGGGKINPTLLNSWEGAYFNFNAATLIGMIDDAADMGLEMFVLDDGWFGNGEYARNNDRAGLGDWELNTEKLPEGIDSIASHAHDKGLKFGIWIEPEMVNPKSNLANNHPDWVVRSQGREIYTGRNQWLLDLSNPAVQDFVYGVFDRTMQLSDKIDYIKWDCNRVVNSFGSDWQKDQDRFFVEYVQGYYKVLRRIREKYPDTLIQCCSSGGSRVDYGQLAYHNEVWTSDNTDAICRSRIQNGTSLIYPASIMGCHVSAVPNHQSGAITPLKFRFDMACAGRLGMELQPKDLTPEERVFADRCIKSYKQYRDLVFNGDLYRLVAPEEGRYALMYVSQDKRRAVVYGFNLSYESREIFRTLRLDGLNPDLRYKVNELNVEKSCWWGNGDTFTGDFLMNGGFNPRLDKTFSSAIFYLEAE
ncbi:MAG: alpha-galactosidase, partial [Bacteroidales bacterium]|nr:alpha-galactosidase [Bacteroidales bacterium]